MKQRHIILTIETLSNLLKDYFSPDDLPTSALPVKLMFNPAERKLAVQFTDDSWPSDASDLTVHFDIRRVYTLGGK